MKDFCFEYPLNIVGKSIGGLCDMGHKLQTGYFVERSWDSIEVVLKGSEPERFPSIIVGMWIEGVWGDAVWVGSRCSIVLMQECRSPGM